MTSNSILARYFYSKPKNVFLLDGIGAMVSAISLGVVLVLLHPYVGMPKSTLHTLSCLALGYAIYSFCCYFMVKKNWSLFLQIIASFNLFHCLITVYLMFLHFESLTALGICYFVVEILIVIGVAMLELKVANLHNYN